MKVSGERPGSSEPRSSGPGTKSERGGVPRAVRALLRLDPFRHEVQVALFAVMAVAIGASALYSAHHGTHAGIYLMWLYVALIPLAVFFLGYPSGMAVAGGASLVAVYQMVGIWYPADLEAVQQLFLLIVLFNLVGVATGVLIEWERKRRREMLRQAVGLYAASSSLLELTLSSDPLRFITQRAAELVNARYAVLVLYDEQGHISHLVSNLAPEEEARIGRLPEGKGILGMSWEPGQVLRIDDLASHSQFSGFPPGHPVMKTFIGVPLVGQQRLLGRFYICNKKKGAFTRQDEHLLLSFATLVTTAVENSLLYQTVERRAQELAALIDIDRDISTTLDLPRVLERIARHARDIIDADDSDIYLLDPLFAPGADTLRVVVSLSAYADEIMSTPIRLGEGIVGWVAQQGQAEIVNHAERDPRSKPIPGTPLDPESLLCAPLIIQDRVIGVMVLSRMGGREFAQADLDFLVSLAQQASIAIHNAWLYANAQRRARALEALCQTALDVTGQLEMSRLLATIVRRATELLDMHGGSIYLMEPGGESLRLEAVHNIPARLIGTRLRLGEGGAGRVAQTGQPLVIDDYRTWPGRAPAYEGESIAGAVLEVPIKWREQITGVLACHTRAGVRQVFTPEDVRLLESFAQQVAVAVENARLFQAVQQQSQELAEALARQQELDRLQTEFIQNVSHELRTPLALIRGYAEMLDMGALGTLAPEQEGPVSIIARRARMLGDLVEDITAILELEGREIELHPVDLGQLVRHALEDFEAWARQKGVTLIGQVDPSPAGVMGEARHLRRLVDNLIGNAIKFTPQGGRVFVSLRTDPDALVLQVRDTGIGIPSDKLERIFDRFYQVDGSIRRRYGGTGLGLALVKEIVKAHGGQVSVQSQVDVGSTFTVRLPLEPVTQQ